MSDLIEDMLRKWGLSQYIEKFKDEQVDEQAFLHMPDSMIKELISSVGHRFSFLTNRKIYLESINETSSVANNSILDTNIEESENQIDNNVLTQQSESEDNVSTVLSRTSELDNISIASSSSMDTCFNRKKNLRNLLSESGTGKKLLTQTRLTPSDRNNLCKIIIEKLLSKSMKIKTEEFQDWSTEIVNLFQYEKTSTYFVPSNAKLKRLASGKLWDKYNNLKKLVIKHKKACEEDNVEITPENNDDCEEALIALRAIQPEDINIEKLWKETFTRRNRGTSIRNYYEEYPILKTAIGATLLQIDFQLETKTDTLTFQKKWPEIAPYIRLLAEKTEVCPTLCEVTNGFVESFSTNMCCRFCKVSKDVSRKLCSEDVSILRNKENYAEDIATNNFSFTGIKQQCTFNVLDSFHAIENYSVDIMHDLLEGVCVYEMNNLLYYCIVEKHYFTLETLNWRLKFFDFGSANRPPTISQPRLLKKSIKMSASEMLSFVSHSGLIFGDLITDLDDRYWELFILLRKILLITLQDSVTESTADLLENLIYKHHMLYIDLFGETLKPKHHLMVHYPRIIKIVGPLRSLWAMRFEAKHRPLKQYARTITSRVNLCYSIGVKEQLILCDLFAKMQSGFFSFITYKQSTSIIFENKNLLNDYTNYIILKSLSIGNISFKKESIVLLSINNDNYPTFAKIIDIFKSNSTVSNTLLSVSDFVAHVQCLFTNYFDVHYQAYAINISNKCNVVNFSSLVYYKIFTLIQKTDGNFYISC